MAESKKYREYFDINPKYYAAVTPELVDAGEVSWKSFYPHETFLKLLKEVKTVLSGQDTRSMWVEGAYGTGKSHAVFTIKKMLEARDEEIREYFEDYGLSRDLCQQIITGKNKGKLLVVQRTGSSDIKSDQELILKVQETIMAALAQEGIENQGEGALSGAALNWLREKESNRKYFSALMSEERYSWDFSSKPLEQVMEILEKGSDAEKAVMMRGIMKVARDNNILAMQMDAPAMAKWLTDLIAKNHLGGIIFIWDEFTDYLRDNSNSLSGFQTLAALSQDQPFYFLIVTHGSEQLIANYDEVKKIQGRFLQTVKIELPDNIAFRLMKQAMKTTGDVVLKEKWKQYAASLNVELGSVRKVILDSLGRDGIKDEDLRGIVPMHPLSALLLKHISTVVGSNQRSMFEYIINNNPDAHDFKWYINTYGPMDMDARSLLTIDMLWNFFNLAGQNGQVVVNSTVRVILGNYNLHSMEKYSSQEQRVFKTLLLLQAISSQLGGSVELLRPTDRNLELAYDGTDWQRGKATAIAEQLCKDNLLFKQTVGKDTEYTVASSHGDAGAVEKNKKNILDNMKTGEMVMRARLLEAISLPQKVKNRFRLTAVSLAESLSRKGAALAADPVPYGFHVAAVFALEEQESQKARQEIEKLVREERYKGIYFLDATSMYMGLDQKEQYASDMAYSEYYLKQDKKTSENYSGRAEECLGSWRSRVENGSFILYSYDNPSGVRLPNLQSLVEEFLHIEEQVYPYSLASFNVIDNMFKSSALGQGAGCGIKESLEGTYKSPNKQTSLDTALSGVWKVENYWQDSAKQSLPLVRAKLKVEEMIAEAFKEAGRISIRAIFEELRGGKFGYMPCNFTSFVLGFLLKEYALPKFFWSNSSTSKPMSQDVLKKMIADVLNPPRNYKEEFIVAMSPQLSAFLTETAGIFHLPQENCGSVEQARDYIRINMRKMDFPIWCLKSILGKKSLRCPADTVETAIDDYVGIANTANGSGGTESDLAGQLGQLFLDNKELAADLADLIKNDAIREGMKEYVSTYKGGEILSLTGEIGPGISYLDDIRAKFNADAANWVWNQQTADEKVDDVILEYRIIKESNKSLPKTYALPETVRAWNQKTDKIHIACEAMSMEDCGLKDLLHLLHKMKQQDTLPETDKQAFCDRLVSDRENFEDFYNGQFAHFYKASKSILRNMSEDEARELFENFADRQFTKSRTDYFRYVEAAAKEFVENQAKTKLRNLWKEKTGTKDPFEWSRKNRTPILCMFDEDERHRVKKVFGAMRAQNPHREDVEAAFAFLSAADFYGRLSDPAEINACFKKRVVGDYDVILEDIEATRDYLQEHAADEAYYWMDSDSVRSKLKDLAEKEYMTSGCEKALEIVEELDEREMLQYLRTLIGESLNVGIEILKHGRRE
ncbi:hypothetical protein [Selenomonas sp. KH1T6]|uniref:hypothetical protein n=1 Tax=Selenomonas sp. KH1T6 TaxID=3158784 RepID=UPI0008A778C6|nr:hypothetical protein SAMN05216583_1127 [Selenomonas ruminantium]